MRKTRIAIVPLLFAALFMIYQYFSAEKITNPVTGRSTRVALSSEQEETLGLQSFREVLSQSEVVSSGSDHDVVVKVAERLALATGTDAKDFKWEVSLVRSPQANAFCLPGGKIVVFTGILPISRNEAGLATVMGHEMAHAIARHGSQRLLRTSMAQTLLAGASLSLGDMDFNQRQAVMAALGAGAQYGVLLPFSREHEAEADEMGLIYMARAGYDPREALAFWERMDENATASPPEFLSTHPSHGSRIANLRAWIPKAIEDFERAKFAASSQAPP